MGADVEIEGDRAICRVPIDPSAFIGMDAVEVPRAAAMMVIGLRKLRGATLDDGLAERMFRAAFRAASNAPDHWQIFLSDTEIRISIERNASAAERAAAAAIGEAIVDAVLEVIRSSPVRPWKRGLLEAWSIAAAHLGAELVPETLTLIYVRAGVRAQASVRLERTGLVTEVRIPIAWSIASASSLQSRRELEALGCSLRVGDNELEVTRSGLLASAEALRDVLDAAFALASEYGRRSSPYR